MMWLSAIFFLPGWAFLSMTQLWKKWDTLQRWVIAVGISTAFFPVLFYFTRELLPAMHLGRNKLIVLFVVCIAVIVFFQRHHWKSQFSFDRLECLAISIFIATIFIRLLLAVRYPFPAWSDSLHHTLITQLTANNGQLPYTLEPYEPVLLNMYHLGLYAITGPLQILTGIPAYSALVWTAQFLNGLCGLGVYLVLDRLIGRRAGIIGALVVGFYSFQPNWYINWGRFTQLSSQTILLIAWLVTWEAIRSWQENGGIKTRSNWFLVFFAGLLNAGVFLLHFRVAGYYLPLLLIIVIFEVWRSIKNHSVARSMAGIAIIGTISLALVSPAIIPSLKVYVQQRVTAVDPSQRIEYQQAESDYYSYTLGNIFDIGARKWLMGAAGIALVISLVVYPKLSLALIGWMVLLWLEGNAYRLNIPILGFTNYSAIMIMFYIPIGLFLGTAGEAILNLPQLRKREILQTLILGIAVFGGFISSHQRMADIEPYRFFLTPGDVEAMEWIRNNTPQDALFAINTYMWLGNAPHGTDGGYWIPYFTDRKTTTGTMLHGFGGKDYNSKILTLSSIVVESTSNPNAIAQLRENGVNYIYRGAKGTFTGPGLRTDVILSYPGAELVYSKDNVDIFKILQ